ncbi:MAG TPA: FAD-dependent monooxygenase [Falsiroseomonas sp.]|jgi:flavin-dependent dehydrogenase|nr:FAD-dependent monooxygenase [Falsiroseomonas sp.]
MSGTVIIGGGPAGAAAAFALARAGRPPLLLERDPLPTEKVCGEFLAEDASRLLRALGLDLAALGAVPITRALFAAGHRHAELRLPFDAWSLPRATLDAALLGAARDAGAELRLGALVRGAERSGQGWRVRLSGGEVLGCRELVLATGKHELRGLPRAAQGGSLGLKLPLRGVAPEAAVALLLCGGGYAGLQPRPGGGANLCAALDPTASGVAEAARSAGALLAHVARGSALAERLLAALRPAAGRPMAVAGVPYGFLHRGDGPFRIGDQAAVIPSFCGDGVAMALGSGLHAAAALASGTLAASHHAAWRREVRGGMRMARMLAFLVSTRPRLLVAALGVAPALAGWAALRTRHGAANAALVNRARHTGAPTASSAARATSMSSE